MHSTHRGAEEEEKEPLTKSPPKFPHTCVQRERKGHRQTDESDRAADPDPDPENESVCKEAA